MRTVVQPFSSFIPESAWSSGSSRPATRPPRRYRDREVTVMFTDIIRFTAITENARPGAGHALTHRALAALSDAVIANSGTVGGLLSNAVMAISNTPSDRSDHVVHACAGALPLPVRTNRAWTAYSRALRRPTARASDSPQRRHRRRRRLGQPRWTTPCSAPTASSCWRRAFEPLDKDYGAEVLVRRGGLVERPRAASTSASSTPSARLEPVQKSGFRNADEPTGSRSSRNFIPKPLENQPLGRGR